MPIDQATTIRSHESKVTELCGVFPNRTHSDIVNALESSNGDLQDASTILLAELSATDCTSASENGSDQLEELQIMFPGVNADKIKAVYGHSHSIETAITELLSLPLLSLEDNEEQKKAEEQLETQSAETKGPTNSDETTVWKAIPTKIKKIREYTAVTDSVARQALHENSFNTTKAIIDLIWTTNYYNEGSQEDHTEDSKQFKTIMKNPRGGKVQTARGFAHVTKNSFDPICDGQETPTEAKGPDEQYIYSGISEEVQELQEMLRSNPSLRSINIAFFKRALTFYKGDLSMTASLASHIIEADLSNATYRSPQNNYELELEKGFKIIGKNSDRGWSSLDKTGKPKRLDPPMFQNDEHYNEGQRMIEHLFELPRLDFHGFVPKDAINVLKPCLDKWWGQELSEREMNRQKLSISRALNVFPLEVVTGRGIHSVGGKSTLKIKVRRFLNDHNYLFSEEPAYFVVLGKKK